MDVQKEARDYAVGEFSELADGTATEFIDTCQEASVDVEGSFSNYNEVVNAADTFLDDSGERTIYVPKGTYLGNVLQGLADSYVSMAATQILYEMADEVRTALEDLGCDLDEVQVVKSNPFGHMVHTTEEDQRGGGILFVYHIEDGCQAVLGMYDVYFVYFPTESQQGDP